MTRAERAPSPAAMRISREARAFAVGIFLSFTEEHPAVQAMMNGKDPAIWDFFVAIAAMGTICLRLTGKRRQELTKGLHDALAARHPDAGRALLDFIALAERAADPAGATGAWVLSNLTLRKPSPKEQAAARSLGLLIHRDFQAGKA